MMKFWQSKNNPQCKLSQQDLIDISEEINQKYTPFDNHHQPELVLMPVDPINLYAYWNLKGNQAISNADHIDKQLALRIYSIPELSEHPDRLQLSFDIKVYGFRNQQKVQLPIAATAYSAVVGEINADNSFSPLAISDTIHVPRENPASDSNLNGNETILQKNQEQEKVISTPTSQEGPDFSRNIIDFHHKLQFATKMNSNADKQANPLEILQPKAYILKNFNDNGYDLKIYENGFAPDFKKIFLQSDITTQLNDITAKAIGKNISGQGRLL